MNRRFTIRFACLALVASGSEQVQTFTLGGMAFPADPNIPGSLQLTHVAVGPMEAFNADVTGGAGGTAHSVQDYAYGPVALPSCRPACGACSAPCPMRAAPSNRSTDSPAWEDDEPVERSRNPIGILSSG